MLLGHSPRTIQTPQTRTFPLRSEAVASVRSRHQLRLRQALATGELPTPHDRQNRLPQRAGEQSVGWPLANVGNRRRPSANLGTRTASRLGNAGSFGSASGDGWNFAGKRDTLVARHVPWIVVSDCRFGLEPDPKDDSMAMVLRARFIEGDLETEL